MCNLQQMHVKGASLILLLFVLSALGCSQSAPDSESTTNENTRPDNELVDTGEFSLVPVCTVISSDKNSHTRLGCKVKDQDGSQINLAELYSYEWLTRNASPEVTLVENTAKFDLEVLIPAAVGFASLEIILRYKINHLSDVSEALVKVGALLSELENIYQLRLHVDSITKSDPSKPQQLVYAIEFRINDQWLPMQMTNFTPTVGPYAVEFANADLAFISMIMELNRAQAYDLNQQNIFSTLPPYDVSKDPAPSITIKFNEGVRVNGMRINGGLPIELDNIKTGFFDRFRIATADIDGNFTQLDAGQFDLRNKQDADALVYIWDSSCKSKSPCECGGNTKYVCQSEDESIYLVELAGLIQTCKIDEGEGQGWSCGPDYSCYKKKCTGDCPFVIDNVCYKKEPFNPNE